MAVKLLLIEAMRNKEEEVTGIFFSISVYPWLPVYTNFPSTTIPNAMPGK